MNSLGTDFDTALTRGATAALALAGLWVAVVVVTVALEARTGGRVRLARRTGCPPALRAWLLGVFVALFAAVAPAQASDSGSHHGPPDARVEPPVAPLAVADSGPAAVAVALDGLPLPDRSTGRPVHRPTLDEVVVEPGDSLWRIARSHLPGTATEAAVSRAVAALYAANHRLIGPDPDHLEPGQHLHVPDPTTFTEER